jgi:hypothetical protein
MRWRRLLLPIALAAIAAPPAAGPIVFEEIAGRSGLRFVTNSSPTPNKNQPETMVAGVGLLDYDNDGYLDVYFVNGAASLAAQRVAQYWNRLFHNNRDGTFTDVTEKAGVAGEGYGMGVAIGDYDNDGWPDIFLANVTGNQLFHNNHDGTFTDVTAKARLSPAPCSKARRCGRSPPAGSITTTTATSTCSSPTTASGRSTRTPSAAQRQHARLLPSQELRRSAQHALPQQRRRHVHRRLREMGIDKFYGKGMGIAFADYDHDGFMDVFVANDNPQPAVPQPGRQEVRGGRAAGRRRLSRVGRVHLRHGRRFPDVDNDGWDDIWHTAIEGESFPLFKNHRRRRLRRGHHGGLCTPRATCRDGPTASPISTTTAGRTSSSCAATCRTISPRCRRASTKSPTASSATWANGKFRT